MADTNAVFETLAARRRRYVLYYLLEAGNTTLGDLAGLIAAAESGQPVVSVPAERCRRVAVELSQTHLPMLEAQEFVHYESDFVELADEFEKAIPYLELASQYERPPTATRGEI